MTDSILSIINEIDNLPADHEPTAEDLWGVIRQIEKVASEQKGNKMSNEEKELPCLREKDTGDDEWTCVNDHTGCLYNNGNNECGHEGKSTQPLEEPETFPFSSPKQLEVKTEWGIEDVRHNFGELVADLSDDEIWERLCRLGGAFEEACIDSGWTVIQNCFITGDDTDIWQVNLQPKNG